MMCQSNDGDRGFSGKAIAGFMLALVVLILIAGWMEKQDAEIEDRYRCEHGLPATDGPGRLACDEG